MPRFDQLVLPFGLGIAAATLLYWTVWEFDQYGEFVGEGVVRAAVALGAVGVLSFVLYLARTTEQHFVAGGRADDVRAPRQNSDLPS